MASTFEVAQSNPLAHKVVIAAICFLCFTWPVLGLRFWVRHRMLHLLGADDLLALIAQIFYTGYCACLMITIHITPGSDSKNLSDSESTTFAFMASTITYAFGMLFLKLSLGAFFLRIIISPLQRSLVYIIMALSTISNLMEGIWVIFLCGIPDRLYVLKILARQCAPRQTQKGIAYSQAATNMFTDVALAMIPLWLLWNMQMKAWTKISVGGILVLATSGCVASMVRFVYLPLIFDPTFGFYKKVAPLMMICIIELGTGLLACSLATLRPLVSSLVQVTAPARSALSHAVIKSHQKDSNGISVLKSGTSDSSIKAEPTIFGSDGFETRHATRISESNEHYEFRDENGLREFSKKPETIMMVERGRTEGSDISLL